MISVRNRRPLLSGNKWLLLIGLALIVGACSPKIRPVAPPAPEPVEKPAEEKPVEKPVVKPPARVSVISLLMPFGLDHLSAGKSYTSTSLTQANLAVDYYRGFKLALDSLTSKGFNYKLQLLDSKGLPSESKQLAYNQSVKASDLIVGPVFPDDLKAFTSVPAGPRKPILSPLAPSAPSTFKDQNVITAMPPLEYHAWAAAKYILKTFKPRKVFVLRSGFSEETGYTIPFKKAIDSLSNRHTLISQTTVVHGNLSALETQLNINGKNVFVIPSTDQAFLMVTLRTLDSLSDFYPIVVIGHPNWIKFNFLKAEMLEHLNTYITCSEKVDYKAQATITFLKSYRNAYHAEASDYAIKGFDEGLYFGGILGADASGLKKLDHESFTGLHNSFQFVQKAGLGWVNTHVNIYHYVNFDLKQVE